MQKNVPKYTPPWVRTIRLWAESSRREVSYALCDDRRTLLWFANQRAVEYHPTLSEAGQRDQPDYLVLDIDPPSGGEFRLAVRAAQLVREALAGLRAGGRGQDQRGEGGARVRADHAGLGRGRRGGHPRGGGPGRAARPGAHHHRLHPGGPGGEGLPRLDPGGRGHRGGGLQPPDPARGPGVLPAALGRAGPGDAGRLHRAHRGPADHARGPVGGASCPRRSGSRPTWSRRATPSRCARVQAMHEGKRRARRPPQPPADSGQAAGAVRWPGAQCTALSWVPATGDGGGGRSAASRTPAARSTATPGRTQPEAEPRPGPERASAVPGDGSRPR